MTPRELPHDDQCTSAMALNESGELVHIDSVPRGLACGCHCVSCAEPLIAKQGAIRAHHFSHAQQHQCAGALETLLHRLAKEILRTAAVIALPDYTWRGERAVGDHFVELEQTIVAGGRARLSRVAIEPRYYDGVIPDVVFTTQARDGSSRTVLLEIAVRHAVDAEKRQRLRKLSLPALELTLNPAHARMARSALEDAILKGVDGKRWLFHPRQVECERRFEELYRREQESFRKWEAEQAQTTRERTQRLRRALASNPNSESRNPMAQFLAQHGRYPTLSETSAAFHESISKRKSK